MRTRTTTNFTLFLFAVAALTISCNGGSGGGFKTDETTGVQYRFINHDENGAKPNDTCIAHIKLLWTGKNVKGDADSVYFDSHKRGDSLGAIFIPLRKAFKGCLEQGVMMMAKGDSAEFLINADSLYLKFFRYPADKVPHYITSTTTFTFAVKLVGFQTQREMMAQRQADIQKRNAASLVLKAQEPPNIAAYLQKNNYTNAKADEDSIFTLEAVKGKGKPIKEGDSVYVSYTGTLLSGTVFDQSNKGPGHTTLNILYTQKAPLIKGWVHLLGKMRQGDKVKVLIPSAMAYGSQSGGVIQPYSTLVFDMEIVQVKSNK